MYGHRTVNLTPRTILCVSQWDLKVDAVAQNSVTGSWTGVLKRVSNL